MACMRCGRETEKRHVFCNSCQQNMERYPVKPGTVIHLPHRPETAPSKKASRKRSFSPEEQIQHLRKVLRRLRICLILLVILLGMAITMAAYEHLHPEESIIGRNYTIETADSAD